MASGYINCESCGNKRYIVRAKATQMSPEEREPCKECNFNEWLTWANNYRGYASVKQLTIEELRGQFEKGYCSQYKNPTIAKERHLRKTSTGDYVEEIPRNRFLGYVECAIDCGILKQ